MALTLTEQRWLIYYDFYSTGTSFLQYSDGNDYNSRDAETSQQLSSEVCSIIIANRGQSVNSFTNKAATVQQSCDLTFMIEGKGNS